jgi:hypothetical protein
MSPAAPAINLQNHDFEIKLKISDFPNISDINETIEPYPTFDLFDYRISGSINSDGKGTLNYSLQKIKNSVNKTIHFDINKKLNVGS